jgi:hypothetical protein
MMSNDPNVIRQEIESTRVELSSDVDALTNKVNPRRMASERVERARGRLGRVKDKVMGSATHGRQAVGQRASHAGHRLTDTAHQASDAVSGAAHQASSAATGAAHQASDAVSGAAHQASSAASGATHRASDAASSVAGRVRAVPEMSRQQTEGSPLAAGLIAFGLGLLASSLIRPSEREQQLAAKTKHKTMQHSGELKHVAGDMAHHAQGNLREPAQHAAKSVASKAAESASAVRKQGMASAQQARGQARESRDDLRR